MAEKRCVMCHCSLQQHLLPFSGSCRVEGEASWGVSAAARCSSADSEPCLCLRLLSNTTFERGNASGMSTAEWKAQQKPATGEVPSELYALAGAVSFSAAEDPLLALRAITEGTCCDCACVESMLKQPENAFKILLYIS